MSGLPKWSAPIVGAFIAGGVGVYVGTSEMKFDSGHTLVWFIISTTLMGAVAGGILWFWDAREKR
jgi:hypothetical protein